MTDNQKIVEAFFSKEEILKTDSSAVKFEAKANAKELLSEKYKELKNKNGEDDTEIKEILINVISKLSNPLDDKALLNQNKTTEDEIKNFNSREFNQYFDLIKNLTTKEELVKLIKQKLEIFYVNEETQKFINDNIMIEEKKEEIKGKISEKIPNIPDINFNILMKFEEIFIETQVEKIAIDIESSGQTTRNSAFSINLAQSSNGDNLNKAILEGITFSPNNKDRIYDDIFFNESGEVYNKKEILSEEDIQFITSRCSILNKNNNNNNNNAFKNKNLHSFVTKKMEEKGSTDSIIATASKIEGSNKKQLDILIVGEPPENVCVYLHVNIGGNKEVWTFNPFENKLFREDGTEIDKEKLENIKIPEIFKTNIKNNQIEQGDVKKNDPIECLSKNKTDSTEDISKKFVKNNNQKKDQKRGEEKSIQIYQ